MKIKWKTSLIVEDKLGVVNPLLQLTSKIQLGLLTSTTFDQRVNGKLFVWLLNKWLQII